MGLLEDSLERTDARLTPCSSALLLVSLALTLGLPICAQIVELEFQHLYPGEVKAIHLVYDCDDLDDLVSEYDKVNSQNFRGFLHNAAQTETSTQGVYCSIGSLPNPFEGPLVLALS